MNKQPEITMQTKRNLMDAFWQLYCKKRIEKITVKEITTRACYWQCYSHTEWSANRMASFRF